MKRRNKKGGKIKFLQSVSTSLELPAPGTQRDQDTWSECWGWHLQVAEIKGKGSETKAVDNQLSTHDVVSLILHSPSVRPSPAMQKFRSHQSL